MKKKLFVFLTIILGGIFILLYNPLKELASSSGEVKAAETNAAPRAGYSALETFLMTEGEGPNAVSYTLTKNETITHEITLGRHVYLFGGGYTITLAADLIISNKSMVAHGPNYQTSGGYIIMTGPGNFTNPVFSKIDLSIFKFDDSFQGTVDLDAGQYPGILSVDYKANIVFGGNSTTSTTPYISIGANFTGVINLDHYSACIYNYSGTANKIKIVTVSSFEDCSVTLDSSVTGYDLIKKEDELAYYLVRKGINFIPKPTESSTEYIYNGNNQTYLPDGFDEATMNISNNVQKDAESYTVTVSFKDTYGWDDGTVDPIEFTFTIGKADLTLTLAADNQTATYSGKPASITNSYTKSPSGLKGTDKVDVVTIGGTAVYKYSSANYTTNTVAPTNAGNYTIALSGLSATADNYTVTVEYTDGTLAIQPKDVTVEFSNYENLVYNKNEQEITVNLNGVIDGETCTITEITGNKGKPAGDYTCSVTEISNPNYALSGTTTLAWSIAKYQVEKPVEDTTVYTYTGEEQTYQVEASEFYTVTNQTQKEAGTYIVTITLNDTDNYEWKDDPTKTELEYSFTIHQKAVDIIWSENTFTYNGEEQDKTGIIAYYLTLPSSTKNYLTVKCNSESFKLANTYTFTVELDDTKNYTVANSSNSHSYTIDKATVSGITFTDKEVDYNGEIQTIEITGELPEEISVEYHYNSEVFSGKKEANSYLVEAIFTVGDNYNEIAPMTATLTIQPKAIEVSIEDQSSSYTGEEPEIDQTAYTTEETGDLGIVITKEAGVAVGEYKLTATSTNTNYDITFVYTNGDHSIYTIEKASFSYTVENYSGTYDKESHNGAVNVSDVDSSVYTIYYSTAGKLTESNYSTASTNNPSFTDAGTTTVYYYIVANDYKNRGGSFTVEITKKEVTVTFSGYEGLVYDSTEKTITVTLDGILEGDTCTITGITGDKNTKVGSYTCEVTEISNPNYVLSGTTTQGYTIEKATPSITPNQTAPSIYLGQTLANSKLAELQASVEGKFSWVNVNIIPSVGTNEYEVIFTPDNLNNYNAVIITVNVTVNELPKDENGNVKVDADNYAVLKDILDNYDKLAEDEKDKLDDKTKEEILRIEKAIQEYDNENNLAKVLILSIGIPCSLALIAGIVLRIRRKRKVISISNGNDEDEDD